MIKTFSQLLKNISESTLKSSFSSSKHPVDILVEYPYLFKGLKKRPFNQRNSEQKFKFVSIQTKQFFYKSYQQLLRNIARQNTVQLSRTVNNELMKKLCIIQTEYFSGNSNEISMFIENFKIFVLPEGKNKKHNFDFKKDSQLPFYFPEQFTFESSGVMEFRINANYFSYKILRPVKEEYKYLIQDNYIFGRQVHNLEYHLKIECPNFKFLEQPYVFSKIISNPQKFGAFKIDDIDHSKTRKQSDLSRYIL